jgi:hypothetical protein
MDRSRTQATEIASPSSSSHTSACWARSGGASVPDKPRVDLSLTYKTGRWTMSRIQICSCIGTNLPILTRHDDLYCLTNNNQCSDGPIRDRQSVQSRRALPPAVYSVLYVLQNANEPAPAGRTRSIAQRSYSGMVAKCQQTADTRLDQTPEGGVVSVACLHSQLFIIVPAYSSSVTWRHEGT